MTPEQIAKHVLRPDSDVGSRVRAHLAPPLLEDLHQAIAGAIRDVARRERRNAPAKMYIDHETRFVEDLSDCAE
jgi:hypothetical protein